VEAATLLVYEMQTWRQGNSEFMTWQVLALPFAVCFATDYGLCRDIEASAAEQH